MKFYHYPCTMFRSYPLLSHSSSLPASHPLIPNTNTHTHTHTLRVPGSERNEVLRTIAFHLIVNISMGILKMAHRYTEHFLIALSLSLYCCEVRRRYCSRVLEMVE